MSQSNEAVVVLKAHIKKLENQKAALDQKFKRCHTNEFLDEMSKLRHETLSLDVLKEIDKIKDPHELSKALNEGWRTQSSKGDKVMAITLSWPVIAIIVFVVASQIWAWTRDGACSYFAISDRGFAVFFATIADALFTAIVGGIWIW